MEFPSPYREVAGKFESSNVSRDNVSRGIGRTPILRPNLNKDIGRKGGAAEPKQGNWTPNLNKEIGRKGGAAANRQGARDSPSPPLWAEHGGVRQRQHSAKTSTHSLETILGLEIYF